MFQVVAGGQNFGTEEEEEWVVLPPFSSSPPPPVGAAARAVTDEGGGMSHVSKHTFSNVLYRDLGQPALGLLFICPTVLQPYLKSAGVESGSGCWGDSGHVSSLP